MAKTNIAITPAKIQKLLSDPKYRIELHNLMHEETEKVYKILSTWNTQMSNNIEEVAIKRIKQAEEVTADLTKIFAYGNYFGLEDQSGLWGKSLNRLGTLPFYNGSVFLIDLQSYPALLVLYAGGLSALAAERYYNLRVLLDAKTKSEAKEPAPLVLRANCTMLGQHGNRLLGFERRKTPLSDHLNELFKNSIPNEIAYKEDFDQLFDRWEIIVGMVVADFLKERPLGAWAPVGAFSWREEYSSNRTLNAVGQELDGKADHPLLKAGLFGGSASRAKEAYTTVKEIAEKVAFF